MHVSTVMNLDDADSAARQRKIVNRLRRAQGQLAAVINAIEAGKNCRDVVTQLSAVSSAIDRAGYSIIATAMRECVIEAKDIEEGRSVSDSGEKLTVDELEKLFLILA